ncbi:helix-turn-helix domain-containing protein [Zafaria sp. Z1313]|uniref:helix-turn-helix domain-containing protein n=1 Tax=unclassified Zafaria TaxID=2828765 RepID=UPI002E7872AD|nr:XRE family transcriptional regulator [Zafaria sp. J156]MEE1619785.1 XRE family transcriptional regulator [Zafaria sp. J156]
MTGNQDIAALIGQRIRARRTARQWTLDELANRAGVSRRTLVMIEQGQANPSIAVLSGISDALGVAFVALVGAGSPDTLLVRRAGEGAVLWEGDDGGAAHLAGSLPGANVAEQWQWRMEPGEEHLSSPHPPGTRELVVVHAGRLRLGVAGEEVVLAAGDSAAHPGDVEHSYSPAGRGAVGFSVVVQYPASAAPAE